MTKLDMVRRLLSGEVIEGYKESGNSMTPLIKHREPVTIEPVDPSLLERGDIVFVKVRGRFYTHLVSATRKNQIQISNNHGHVNGWVSVYKVFGIVTQVGDRELPKARSKVRLA